MFLPYPVIDDDVQVTRATHFEVRAGASDVTAVVDHLSRAVDEAVSVAEAVQYADGGRRLELACGSTVRLVMQPAHPARSRPAGTWMVTVLVEGRSPSEAEKVLDVARRVPFTGLEMQDLMEQMPLTAGMPTHLRRGSLSGIAPVLTVHHMRDFLVLVEALRALGVPEACMTVLDKGYRYRDAHRVDAHLRAMGVPVWPWQEAAAAVRDHVRRARTAGCRGLLIDDGGYTLPVVLDQCPQLAADFVGLVEQTASGIAKLAPYGELPLPVFSVAESRLKAAVEPYGISDAALRNLSALLPEEKWEGQPALVLGFGRIGA
ncbi:hypothetical protein [Streptomyces cacaoi]|uniref:hypothetical protein n=1 Tax=Streptomyces cacaoi TaxID=1898 RepID=UPI002613596E|nr:hypothetical protein [Streptomyces cacaoi]